ncbi:uncharacterized protein FRV6_16476 [Fusarium oxysporum]|uniref:Uncharacterized protein n=1 Tax=Fusarium oxysporum TaxID=5507 RepID=A0A2H3TUQ9_FUSOX|nr:uncharacterized protein FRV6_16476 [Fusarium oxysporum]
MPGVIKLVTIITK